LESDVEFVAPCQSEVQAYAANGIPIFTYSFDFMPRGEIVEEDRRFFTMFGDNAIGIKRHDRHLNLNGNQLINS
jgi:hypothetical protein